MAVGKFQLVRNEVIVTAEGYIYIDNRLITVKVFILYSSQNILNG